MRSSSSSTHKRAVIRSVGSPFDHLTPHFSFSPFTELLLLQRIRKTHWQSRALAVLLLCVCSPAEWRRHSHHSINIQTSRFCVLWGLCALLSQLCKLQRVSSDRCFRLVQLHPRCRHSCTHTHKHTRLSERTSKRKQDDHHHSTIPPFSFFFFFSFFLPLLFLQVPPLSSSLFTWTVIPNFKSPESNKNKKR